MLYFLPPLYFSLEFFLGPKFSTIILMVIISLISFLRYGVGYDYFNYLYVFENSIIDVFEPGFQLLYTFLLLFFSPELVISFIGLLTIAIIGAAYLIHRNTIVGFVLFSFSSMGFLISLSTIRASLSVALLTFGISLVLRGSKRSFLGHLFILISPLFHVMSLLPFFIFYFLNFFNGKFFRVCAAFFIIIMLIVAVFYSGVSSLSDRFLFYFTEGFDLNPVKFIVALIASFVFWRSSIDLDYRLRFLSFTGFIFLILGTFFPYGTRIWQFFVPLQFLGVAIFSRKNKRAYQFFLIFTVFGYYNALLADRAELPNLVDYYSILFK